MKQQLPLLITAGLSLVAGAAQAASLTPEEAYLTNVGVKATAQLARMGAPPAGETIRIRARVSSGRLVSVHVDPTSRGRAVDAEMAKALRHTVIGRAPYDLENTPVALEISPGQLAQIEGR